MSKLNKAFKIEASGNIMTPKGRMLYASLFKPSMPKGENDPEKARFQVTLLFPDGVDLTALEEAVEETIAENVSAKQREKTRIKMPFLKTEDQPRFAEYADEYPRMIRCNAKFAPDVVSATNRKVAEDDEADEIYNGRWGRISVRPFYYDHPTGGKGVSLGLQNVQLLDHDDVIAGGRVRAENEFDAVGGDDLEGLE